MRLLFLRGQVPTDRPKEEIMYDNLSDNCDMWTQLARKLVGDDYGEVWYWGDTRCVRYSDNFVERWIPSFQSTDFDFKPDVIIARGGFKEYDHVFLRHPDAFKVYYGAGRRYVPPPGFFNGFDLLLMDHPRQLAVARSSSPVPASLFIKPAADNIFYPEPVTKKYDVIFAANYREDKGIDWFLSMAPKTWRVVLAGPMPDRLIRRYHNVRFAGRVPRASLRMLYSQSRVAVCCSTAAVDSNPRVIPESIACNVPVCILDTVNVWREQYITPQTGRITTKSGFISSLTNMLKNPGLFSPRAYYESHLSLDIAADYLRKVIKERA